MPDERQRVIRVELPWPSSALWPNGRAHRMARAAATRRARHDAQLLAAAAGAGDLTGARFRVTITAFPQSGGRTPDADNVIAACKASLDGIAAAMGVDDSLFEIQPVEYGDRVPGGRIVITVEPTSEADQHRRARRQGRRDAHDAGRG